LPTAGHNEAGYILGLCGLLVHGREAIGADALRRVTPRGWAS
jgi:hypothetical protein